MTVSPRSADDRDLSLLAHHQYFRAIKSVVRLSPEQEQACFEQLAAGKADLTPLARQARERLVETYQPLVVHIARRYVCYCR
ncbi:MAG TPA: hypothetical protein VNE61_11370, partial [Ktedonobacteraceae bacterium]|nr:hypothetical protein [Ktedonobacteraceae bacterium]